MRIFETLHSFLSPFKYDDQKGIAFMNFIQSFERLIRQDREVPDVLPY